jgi:hypothetical protein
MKSILCVLLFVMACGGKKAAPAAPSNDKPAATAGSDTGSAATCPATLNCQPPTDDKDALCKLSAADLKQRCPNTKVVE